VAGALPLPAAAMQSDFDLSIDLRTVTSTGLPSFLNGGGGKLRFDDAHNGLRLGSLRLGWRGDFTPTLRLTAEAVAYGDNDVHPIDLTELALSWRPVPQSVWRSELKVGAFYPAISLEHRMRGWRTPYSLSASAVNTWIGEELRTIGVEYNGDLLRQSSGNSWNFGVTGALYGWNDTAGVIIARRGWALHDRQTTLFGKLGTGAVGTGVTNSRTLFYRDLDHKPGWYGGLTANYRGLLELRALHYDNRADTTTYAPAIADGGWQTLFDSVGARWTPDDNWTLIAQRLVGATYISVKAPPGAVPNTWHFDASFALASWQHGAHRLTARYDDFDMRQDVSWYFFYNRDRGHALTAAWLYTINPRLTVIGEWLQVSSSLAMRAAVAEPSHAVERQLQVGLRFEVF
jgi:hypothetical protein